MVAFLSSLFFAGRQRRGEREGGRERAIVARDVHISRRESREKMVVCIKLMRFVAALLLLLLGVKMDGFLMVYSGVIVFD